MTRSHRFRPAAQSLALAVLLTSSHAAAQATPLPEGISVGAWTFRPSVELRVRAGYRHFPSEGGGRDYFSTAVLGDAPGSNLPSSAVPYPPLLNTWEIAERVRLGIAIDRGPVTGVFILQDSRPFGGSADVPILGGSLFAGLGPYEAYMDVHTKTRSLFLRIGRQKITWGDGHLIGESDWAAKPRSFDAVRFGFSAGDFDVETFAALLELPETPGRNATQNPDQTFGAPVSAGTGAELFGVNGVWHVVPLFAAELTALARVVRVPDFAEPPVHLPTTLHGRLVSGDTFVLDARVSGEQRGFRYSVEGAYEPGHIDIDVAQGAQNLNAFAVAARASLETALSGHLTFGVQGAYASGDNAPLETVTRFDPIAPEQHTNHGLMDLYAWSNLIEAGADISARPLDKLQFQAAYRFVGIASPKGRWTSAALLPVGATFTNESHSLGHETDFTAQFIPWPAITFEAGYGLFVTGEGGKNILDAVGRGRPATQHFAYLQAAVHAP